MSQLAYILGLSTIKPDLIRSETIDDSVIVRGIKASWSKQNGISW